MKIINCGVWVETPKGSYARINRSTTAIKLSIAYKGGHYVYKILTGYGKLDVGIPAACSVPSPSRCKTEKGLLKTLKNQLKYYFNEEVEIFGLPSCVDKPTFNAVTKITSIKLRIPTRVPQEVIDREKNKCGRVGFHCQHFAKYHKEYPLVVCDGNCNECIWNYPEKAQEFIRQGKANYKKIYGDK